MRWSRLFLMYTWWLCITFLLNAMIAMFANFCSHMCAMSIRNQKNKKCVVRFKNDDFHFVSIVYIDKNWSLLQDHYSVGRCHTMTEVTCHSYCHYHMLSNNWITVISWTKIKQTTLFMDRYLNDNMPDHRCSILTSEFSKRSSKSVHYIYIWGHNMF